MIKKCRAFSILFIIICIFILFLAYQNVAAAESNNIVINEVMYDPQQNDNYNEWIELYNPTEEFINISGWLISDNYAQDFLEGDFDNGAGSTIIPPQGYAIVADHGTKIYENFSIPTNAIRLYVDDLSIGNGLGNSKDELILKNKSGFILDEIEWGEDSDNIPGLPADLVDEGNSLSRHQEIDTNNTIADFFESSNPTPGSTNIFTKESSIEIELYPRFLPKCYLDSTYSIPFAIKIKLSNYHPDTNYQLKSYVTKDGLGRWPATQTWDGKNWQYSDRYCLTINTDQNGNWSEWVYLRLNNEYTAYQNDIKNATSAHINVKIKKEDNSTDGIFQEINLLDMDESASNGEPGGCIVGIAQTDGSILDSNIIIVENETGVITGIYKSENNEIDEGFVSDQGYYKITSPVGSNNILKFISQDGNEVHAISNLSIYQGQYEVKISSPENYYLINLHGSLNIALNVTNSGDFDDFVCLSVDQITDMWHAHLNEEKVFLKSKESKDVNLRITPFYHRNHSTSKVTVSVKSEKDIGKSAEITIDLEILAPELNIKKIKTYNESKEENKVFGQGEIVRIKAFLKNFGNENATNVNASFYYDCTDENHFIGQKNYDYVFKYQKYPSVEWDTRNALPGKHKIIVIVDEEGQIDELDEANNALSYEIELLDTYPSKAGHGLLINELYYNTHPNINNEFLCIFNPTSETVDISKWYLTNEPFDVKTKQNKILFPKNTLIGPLSSICITQNASAYARETAKNADFEYFVNSDDDVPQMAECDYFVMSNNGESIALKDQYNHTIDFVVYGNDECNSTCWSGKSIPDSGGAVVLKRNIDSHGMPVDSNTSNDWIDTRKYVIGQSNFAYVNFTFKGEIKTFVSPDCSFETITSELRKANSSIYLNIYEFTDYSLCEELVSALKRNVSVKIFLEGSPVGGITDVEKYILNRIVNYGGDVRFIVSDDENNVYARYVFNHGKYLIIDNETAIIESCNWAKTGVPKNPTFGNREWGIVIKNKDFADYYLKVFFDDWNPIRVDSYSFDQMGFTVPSDFFMYEKYYEGIYTPCFKSEKISGDFSITPVISPDTSYDAIMDMIDSAKETIYIEQLYIYKNWGNQTSPFVKSLIEKSKQGIDIKVILNYNPYYGSTNEKTNQTKNYFEEKGIEVKLIFTNWSYFSNVHNKGLIIDNESVLISSINWNENSVTCNREAGVIIKNSQVAKYYAEVFFYDWNLNEHLDQIEIKNQTPVEYKNTIYIAVIFTMTFALIARDWRKRKWT